MKRKDWDSIFFGFEIAEANHPIEISASETYKLIYVHSKHALADSKGMFVSTRLEMERLLLANEHFLHSKNVFNIKNTQVDQSTIVKLALLSGEYSRFALDPNFKNNEYQRLYETWINNSIVNDDIEIFVSLEPSSNKIQGFITLDKSSEPFYIGLLGVDELARGQGVGGNLVAQCIFETKKAGKDRLNVITQGENKPAQNLYEKFNFETRKLSYIYHLWNI